MFLPSFRSMFTQLIVKLTLNWIYSLSSCVLDSGTKLFDNAKLQATVSIFTPRVTLRIMRQCLYCIVMYCNVLYCIVLQTLVGRDGGLHALLLRGHEYVGYK